MVDLTDKQKQVLSLRADGLLNKQISAELEISEVTIHQHLRACCKKLNASNTAHAIALATQAGILGGSADSPNTDPINTNGENLELTDRDREILQCVAKGQTNAQIATKFEISIKTVENYFQRMALRNGLKGRMPLAMSALKSGQIVL